MLVAPLILQLALLPLLQSPGGLQTELVRAWTADVGGLRNTTLTGVHPVADLVLVADARGGVTALAVESGQVRWFVQLEAPLEVPPSPGGGLLALTAGDQLVVVDVATGGRHLQIQMPSPLAAEPVCDDQRAYLPLLYGNQLAAFDLTTGRERWHLRVADGFSGGARLAGQSIVAVPCADGTLRGVAANGTPSVSQQRWIQDVGRMLGTPAQSGVMLYAATARSVVAVSGDSGRVRWKVFPGGELRAPAVVVDDVVVVQTQVDTVALARDSGRTLWRGQSARPLGAVSGTVALHARDERARLFDATSGRLVNKGLLGLRIVAADPVLIQEGRGGRLAAWRLVR